MTARQRLAHVLQVQRDADAAKQEELEQERHLQLQHVLALKVSLDAQKRETAALAEGANHARLEAAHRSRAERARLEAAGVNAEAVFLARAERRRQRKEQERIRHQDEVERERIAERLQREAAEQSKKDEREEERRQHKEALRMKVSRNVIEVAASQMAQREAQRLAHQRLLAQRQREADERAANLLSTIPASDADDDPAPPSPNIHDAFLAWRDKHTAEAKEGDLLYYQRKGHEAKLHRVLQQQAVLHSDHPRAPIMGRTYHNAPVIASPPLLHFNDFHPSQPLTLTLTLINTSFSFNTIQPLPSPHPSLALHFSPPGRLSSGQSMTLQATWKCEDEREERGVLTFVTESGRVEVPWTVSVRKAIVRLEREALHMEAVVGEHGRDRLRMFNDGATPVRWKAEITSVDGQWREEDDDGETDEKTADPLTAAASCPDFPLRLLLDSGELPGYSHADLPISFTPHVASTLSAQFTVTFSGVDPAAAVRWGSASAFPVRLSLVSLASPLHLTDALLSLQTLITGKLYRSSLTIHNRSLHPHRFVMHTPAPLKDALSFVPAVGWVNAGEQLEVAVRVRVQRADEERVMQGVEQLMKKLKEAAAAEEKEAPTADKTMAAGRAIDLSMTIDVVGQTLPLTWTLRARLTSSLLDLSSSYLAFPPTPLHSSSSIPLTLTNQSTLLQKVLIALHPPLSTPTPCVTVLPLRAVTFNVLFTPVSAVSSRGKVVLSSKMGDEYRLGWEGRGVKGVGVEDGVVKMGCVVDGDEERGWVGLKNDGDREEVVEVVIPERTAEEQHSGEEGRGCEKGFLTARPQLVHLKPGERRRVEFLFAPRIRQEEEEREKRAQVALLQAQAPPSSDAGKPAEAKKDGGEVKAEVAKKKKKLTKEEQAKADEEAKRAEDERIVREAEAARLRQEADAKAEAERLYSSPEARAERERVHPSNPLAPDVAMEWGADDGVEPWSRHARHRVRFYVRGVKDGVLSPRAAAGRVRVLHAFVYTTVVQPTLVLEPGVLEFGRMAVGEKETRVLRVTNVGPTAHAVDVDPLPSSGGFRRVSPAVTVGPGETQTVVFEFAPQVGGVGREVRVASHVRGTGTRTPFVLRGEGFLPSFEVDVRALHLGHAMPSSVVTKAVAVRNTSPAPLTVTARVESSASVPFPCPFTASPSSLVIAPGETAPVHLTFGAEREGTWSVRLALNDAQHVRVAATCNAYPLSLRPDADAAVDALSLPRPPWTAFDRFDDEPALFEEPVPPPLPTSRTARDKSKEPKAPSKGRALLSADSSTAVSAAISSDRVVALQLSVYDRVMRRGGVDEVRFEGKDGVERVGWRVLGGVGEGSAGGAYDAGVVQRDAVGQFFGVEGGSGTVRAGEEGRGEWLFYRERFEEWRKGKGMEVAGSDMRGGEWVESEGRVTLRIGGGGGKDSQPAQVRVESMLLRAWVD